MNPQDEALSVTRADATSFLESAVRNWSHVPRLSNDDLDDVAGALQSFLTKRRHRLSHPTPGDAEVRKALEPFAAMAKYLNGKTGVALGYNHESVRYEHFTAAAEALATPSGRAQGEVGREPTDEMCRAGAGVWLGGTVHGMSEEWHERMRLTWRAMFDAAPPAQDQGENEA